MKKLIQWLANLGRIELLIKMQMYQSYLQSLANTKPASLLLCGYGVYSQNDEDGIIQEIFKRIGTKNKTSVEVSVGSGLESNSHLLLQLGWKCFWFEQSDDLVRAIHQNFNFWITNSHLVVIKKWITNENISKCFFDLQIPIGLDLLSLDIDGNELQIWESISTWRPRVVIVEYNAALGPDVDLVVPADIKTSWDSQSINFGASLKAVCRVAHKLGYVLVSCNYTGVNAFFVQKRYASKFLNSSISELLYQPPRLGGYIKPGFKRKPFVWESNSRTSK